LICLLWDVPESRKTCVVDYLNKSSLIEFKDGYYLHPAVREITKLRLQEDTLHWESTNLAASNFYQSVAGEIRSLQDGILLLESFYHAIASNNIQKALHLLIPKIEIVNTETQSIRTIPKLRTLGYINESLSCLEILHNHIDEIVDQAIVGYLYGQLGDLYTLSGNFEKGIIGYQNSLLLTEKFENGSIRIDHWVDSKGALALLYFHLGDYVQSKKTFYETLEDSNKLALLGKKYLCYLYACLSFLCCQDKSSYHLSQKYINNSIELLPFLENSSQTWIRSYGLYYLTRSLIVHERYCESQTILNKLQVLTMQNYSFRLVENLILLCEGYLFVSQSNNSSAIKAFSYAEKGLQKIGAKYELAEAYFQLGLTYQAKREHDQAETYKAKALELFAQMKAPKQCDRVNQAFEKRSKQ